MPSTQGGCTRDSGSWSCAFCGGLCHVHRCDGTPIGVSHDVPACKAFVDMAADDFVRASQGDRATGPWNEATRLIGMAGLLIVPVLCCALRLAEPPSSRVQVWSETVAMIALCAVMAGLVRAAVRIVERAQAR